MYIKPISSARAKKLYTLPDLTDQENGVHAINIALRRIIDGFTHKNQYPNPTLFRVTRIMRVFDSFDQLLFPQDAAVRSSLHTLYISDDMVLRSHTSSMVPLAIDELRNNFKDNIILCCPGLCFRGNRKGKLHSDKPHQVDIWHLTRSNFSLNTADLHNFVRCIVESIFANSNVPFTFAEIREDTSVSHPYLSQVFKIRMSFLGKMVSIGEAGIVNDSFLTSVELGHTNYSAIAVGIMLDRTIMVVKNIHDIRLLRSKDPRVAQQMRDLTPFTPVSKFPAVTRDLSAVVKDTESLESLRETVKAVLGNEACLLEQIKVVSETLYSELPEHVTHRLNMAPDEKNVLIRLTFRSHERTLHRNEVSNIVRLLMPILKVSPCA